MSALALSSRWQQHNSGCQPGSQPDSQPSIPRDTPYHCRFNHLPHTLISFPQVVLEIKSEQQLANLSQKLQQEGIQHKLWVEQPENYPTCLATKPYRKSQAAAHFRKLQLCKAVLTKSSS